MKRNYIFENEKGKRIEITFFYTDEMFEYQDKQYYKEDKYFEAFVVGDWGYEADGALSAEFGSINRTLTNEEIKERINWYKDYMSTEGYGLWTTIEKKY